MSNQDFKISIVTVCLNSQRTIEKCLTSVIQQRYKNIQHIIVDGDSVDDTKRIIGQTAPKAFMVSEADDGIYDAMNKSFKWIEGDYVLFLNSDDYLVDENVIQNLVDSVHSFPADIYYGNILKLEDSGICGKFSPPGEQDLLEALSVYCLPHQAMLCSHKVFEKIGLFSMRYKLLSDYDWYSKALASGVSFKYLNLDVSAYYMRGASSNTALRLKEFYEIQNSTPLFEDPKKDYIRIFMTLQKINYLENFLNYHPNLGSKGGYILDDFSPRNNLYRLQDHLRTLEIAFG